jgi:CheY-like chemotaxis protein
LARKILLADDSVTAQNMGRKILADAGYEVVTVNNGSAALKKIAELKPDLVILDVYMPGYSGLEVCQRLKESQDSSRIPVLLSVGKLEPFKPEEAQRVRADSYIVKPFEASELLSALSKLEDKVVPRSEPSRPGRFARTVAAVDETTLSASEKSSQESGWATRIRVPAKKSETQQKVADDATIYNPMNRDLRTVVQTTAEKAVERQETAPAVEASVDVAALVPPGLPSDVTPEEVAAIAAASAQIQMAADVARAEAESAAEAAAARQSDLGSHPDSVPAGTHAEASLESRDRNNESARQNLTLPALPALPAPAEARLIEDTHEEARDLPMTMAAAASAGSSRWVAVGVALEGEEANLLLEQEMQKAYAAFVREEVNVGALVAPPEIVPGMAAAESTSAVGTNDNNDRDDSNDKKDKISDPEVQSFTTTAQMAEAAAVKPLGARDAEPNSVSAPEISVELPRQDPVAPEVPQEELPKANLAESSTESDSPQQSLDRPTEAEFAAPEAAAAENPAPPAMQLPEPEQLPETETVRTAAAAWASWRQIRDANETKSEAPEPAPQDFEMSVPQNPDVAAMAVAAGAEQSPQQEAASSSENAADSHNAADVASIVDSVLADLRPKLMAEISRKMAEKK